MSKESQTQLKQKYYKSAGTVSTPELVRYLKSKKLIILLGERGSGSASVCGGGGGERRGDPA